jgi:hypothetical protein
VGFRRQRQFIRRFWPSCNQVGNAQFLPQRK